MGTVIPSVGVCRTLPMMGLLTFGSPFRSAVATLSMYM